MGIKQDAEDNVASMGFCDFTHCCNWTIEADETYRRFLLTAKICPATQAIRPFPCWKDDSSQSDEGNDGPKTDNSHPKVFLDDWAKPGTQVVVTPT